MHFNLYIFHKSFLLLDLKYFIQCFSYVNHFRKLTELAAIVVQQCIVKNVMNKKVNEIGACFYLFVCYFHFGVNLCQEFKGVSNGDVLILQILNYFPEKFHFLIDFFYCTDKRIEWIS